MNIIGPIVIGGVIGLILSFVYVYLVKGNERRVGLILLGTSIGGIVGGVVAWWLTS